MKKKLHLLLLTVLSVGILYFLNSVFLQKEYPLAVPTLTRYTPYILSIKQDGFYELERNTLDIAFMGSSNVHCNINPTILWYEYGITGYDFSADQQPLNATCYYLEELFRYQSPRLVVIDALLVQNVPISSPTSHFSYDFLRSPDLKTKAVFNTVVSDEWLEMLIPLVAYHDRWKNLTANDFAYLFSNKRNYFCGFLGYDAEVPQDPAGFLTTEKISVLSEDVKNLLERVIDLCHKNGANIAFIKTPLSSTEEQQAYFNAVEEYLLEKNVPFLNGNRVLNEIGINVQTDFIDIVHMNYNGADKFTSYLGKWITENFSFEDHRGDENYAQWQKDYEFYLKQRERNISVIKTLYGPAEGILINSSGEIYVENFSDTVGFKLQNDTSYRISFDLDCESIPELFYFDVYGTEFDPGTLDLFFDLKQGSHHYEKVFTCTGMPKDAVLRLVYITQEEYRLENVNVEIVEVGI